MAALIASLAQIPVRTTRPRQTGGTPSSTPEASKQRPGAASPESVLQVMSTALCTGGGNPGKCVRAELLAELEQAEFSDVARHSDLVKAVSRGVAFHHAGVCSGGGAGISEEV